jgi:hypothetical protein
MLSFLRFRRDAIAVMCRFACRKLQKGAQRHSFDLLITAQKLYNEGVTGDVHVMMTAAAVVVQGSSTEQHWTVCRVPQCLTPNQTTYARILQYHTHRPCLLDCQHTLRCPGRVLQVPRKLSCHHPLAHSPTIHTQSRTHSHTHTQGCCKVRMQTLHSARMPCVSQLPCQCAAASAWPLSE